MTQKSKVSTLSSYTHTIDNTSILETRGDSKIFKEL